MGKIFSLLLVVICVLVCGSCGGRAQKDALYAEADSMNRLSYDMRYKDLDASAEAAVRAFELSTGNPTLRAAALNNLGFCAFMRMDFEEAANLFLKARETSNDEIELLVSDVGMMKICQRTSMNKEFYDYRNSALRRMKRIGEDESVLSDENVNRRLNYAVSEFYIVSCIYYYYLQQHKESKQAIDAVTEEMLEGDTAQWIYCRYMKASGGIYVAPTREQAVVGELKYLANSLMVSRSGGYIYFEANILQAIAELLNFRQNRRLLEEEHASVLRLVNYEGLPTDSLPLYCARRSLELFKQYGDWFQISGAYRTIATYYNYSNQSEKALPNLQKALSYVNLHHEKFYHCTDSTDRLKTFIPDAGRPIELKWIIDDNIKTIPEWILRLREQLSRTYSALGMKQESDYNRNIYLDLMDYTRQDKALESRYTALEAESRQLNVLLLLVILSFCMLMILIFILNRMWRKHNVRYLDELKKVQDLCRKMTSAVPVHANENREVVQAVLHVAKDDFLQIFDAVDMQITLNGEDYADSSEEELPAPELPQGVRFYHFDMVSPGKSERTGQLALALYRPLGKEAKGLLQLLLPYLAWTLGNGLNLVSLDDERRRLEKEQYIHEQHVVENKRQNTVKKACLSIVTGILPYIDRVVNEVHKLLRASYAREEEIKRGKFVYINDLITRINEYNDILALWIKMRQGALSLNIESFGLNELFQMIAKGRRSFEMKCQRLVVEPTDAVVKADKALTLFMINTLAENARKYTPEGGEIEVNASETEDYVEISVRDNGPGLSPEDVQRILGEKVYDSGSIGISTASDVQMLQKQKGHGFGLMNCKGIIEKYRKTNAVFSVCRFDIESEVGKGSRFYFRLPKGVHKFLAVCALIIVSVCGAGCSHGQVETDKEDVVLDPGYDSLLVIANDFANVVYDCNVNGYYEDALFYADSVLYYMNKHYLRYSGKKAPLLQLYNSNQDAAEQVWLENGFSTDYYILLDVRNEAAVAGLAVKDFRIYFYNNTAYSVLYKQTSQDNTLGYYCQQMQQSANNKMIAIGLFVLLVIGSLVGYYLLYLRHRLHYRYNMEQVFTINKAVFSAVQPVEQDNWNMSEILSGHFFAELNELLPVSDIALAIYDEETSCLKFTFRKEREQEDLCNQMQRCFDKRQKVWKGAKEWSCFPLNVEMGNEEHCAGVLAIQTILPHTREEDRLLVELVMSYLAVMLYNTVVRVRRKYSDIELAQDDARRASYEENMLHVQNMVLDNCLSTIKHETIYYPNRIKQIIDRLTDRNGIDVEDERKQLQTIDELVNYYKDIFTLLSSCAARQLDEITFRRTDVKVCGLMEQADKYLKKNVRKLGWTLDLQVEVQEEGLSVVGDKVLLSFLLENLLDESVRYPESGIVQLSVVKDNEFVRFSFTDTRRTFSQEELNELFYPSLSRMRKVSAGNELEGTEYLVCKQIIRDHDEFAGRRGCRINACLASGSGFTVWFTVPLSKKCKR